MSNRIAEQLGEVGLPEPVAELAKRDWDAIVVGGGHNGLTAAAYLAKAGQSVLVLERRERLGGAATLERPFSDERFVVSPCAYVVGLLDQLVIDELELERRGLRYWVADPNLWVPFDDGTAFGQWLDDAKTEQNLKDLGVSAKDIAGYWAYEELFDDVRKLLRKGERDTWVGDSPTRDEIEDLLGGSQEMIDLCFEASIAEVLDAYIDDERAEDGAVRPRDHRHLGRPVRPRHRLDQAHALPGRPRRPRARSGATSRAAWGCAASRSPTPPPRPARCSPAGSRSPRSSPGEGVTLDDGTALRAPTVICNADPKRMLGMLGDAEIDGDYRERLDAWKIRSPVVKFNASLERLPNWTAAPGADWPARATVDATGTMAEAQAAFERCAAGEPAVAFGEIYVQTGYDPSPAPEGKHLLSVFGQYAPYEIADGDWDAARPGVAKQFIDLISRFAPDLGDCLLDHEVLGPPDIESRIGLTGGNIFQGEVTPDQMWEGRLAARTPVEGLYLCGAATHPAGQRDRPQRPQRRRGGARRPGRRDRRRLSRAAVREALPSRRGRD